MTRRLPRQALPLIAAAGLLLPAIIALAVWASSQFDQRRAGIQRDALDAAREVMLRADAEAEANNRTLSLLVATRAAATPSTDLIERLLRLGLDNNPSWNGAVLREREGGRIILEVGRQPETRPLRPLPTDGIDQSVSEGVFREGAYCPCVIFHKSVLEAPGRVLTLYVDPRRFQQILLSEMSAGSIGGLVDGDGRFIARSLDFENRVGTLATPYVRRAAETGGEGLYRGRTYEGLENVTAYSASPQTGWSAHVAVDRAIVDSPRSLGLMAVFVAVLAALILALGLLFYAVNEAHARQREEEQLIAMQKAEAISQFTGTVVHDFRNILGVIESGIRLIARKTADPAMATYTGEMQGAIERGKRLVNQLLSFARGDGAEIKPLDLHYLLERSDRLIGRSLGDGIAYEWKVADDARRVHANADQLELALLNLAVNARDAMDGKGAFTIEAARAGEEIAIFARDTGPGVPRASRERIFEAFYSTKGDGKGTGLGLAQVAGAASQAGGRVELQDAPNGGACFVIYLPAEE